MESLQLASTRVLRTLLDQQPTTPAKVAFAWKISAGQVLGRAGTATWTADGTLVVRGRDARWTSELRRARPVILERLTQLVGEGVVRRVRIEESNAHERAESIARGRGK